MTNIDDLTIGQARELAAMFGGQQAPQEKPHPFVGKYCICRCSAAGVHAGYVVAVRGDQVHLKFSRRLWSWVAKGGIALSGVAQFGVDGVKSNLDTLNPEIYLIGVCEIIPCTDEARDSINNG